LNVSLTGEDVFKKAVYVVAAALALGMPLARATDAPAQACQYREEPQVEAVADAARKDKSRVTLLTVSPPEGTEVRGDSILELDIEFHIANFEPEKFFLMAGFPTVTGSMSPDDSSKDKLLKTPSGKVHMCVPLKEVYEHPGVRWPLSMQVSLNEQFPGYSQIQTQSRKASLNSVDVPASALEYQNTAPPEEVQQAIMMVFSHIEMQGALNKVCPARFPEMQTKFVKTYRAWESRNAENIKLIHGLQFESFTTTMRSPAAAAMAFDGARAAQIRFLSAFKDPELRGQCEGMMDYLSDETGDLPIATAVNLEIVQNYLAAKKKAEATK
jgi:hypothetical protein